MAQTKYLSLDGLYYLWSLIKAKLSLKQDNISDLETIRSNASTGAGLATKVSGIAEGAQVNVIETITYGGSALTVTNKTVAIPLPDFTGYVTANEVYTKTEIDSKLTTAMHYKGSVSTYAELPSTGNAVGDFYNITATGANYAWTGTGWDETGQIIDIADITNLEIDAVVSDTASESESESESESA